LLRPTVFDGRAVLGILRATFQYHAGSAGALQTPAVVRGSRRGL